MDFHYQAVVFRELTHDGLPRKDEVDHTRVVDHVLKGRVDGAGQAEVHQHHVGCK